MTDVTEYDNPNEKKHGIVLNSRIYDLLKDLVLIALPGLAAAFGGFGTLYGLSDDILTKVVGTISFLIVLIGILLKISNVKYQAEVQIKAAEVATLTAAAVAAAKEQQLDQLADPESVVVSPPSQ